MAEKAAIQAKKPIPADELSLLCEQLGMILSSGLPLYDGVEALCDNYKDTRYADAFACLNDTVLASGSLYLAVKEAGVFPQYMVEMTQIGEKTGELDSVMKQLAVYYQREAKIRHATTSAVSYPLVLVVMMAALIAVLVACVLPIFENVFRSMGLGMNASSNPLMAVGIGVGKTVLIVAGVAVLLVLVFVLIFRSGHNSNIKNWLFHAIAPLSHMRQKMCASRFAAAMAMMLQSGYPLDESLELIAGMLGDPYITQKVKQCRQGMLDGMPFPEAVEKTGLFEKLHCRMIRVGFQAGKTDNVMFKLAAIYEEEMDESIDRLVSIIEPSLVALLSIIIGAILLSVMLPLLSLMSGIV